MLKLSAWLAIAVGLLLAAGQVARNYDNMENVQTWAVDVFAGLVMVASGLLALRKQTTRLLPVGWSFACGLYVTAFITHLTIMQEASGDWYIAEQRLVFIIGGLLTVSLAGLALVLFAPKQA